jgi:hypothetical protein
MALYDTPRQRAHVERTLREGAYKGSFTAAGYALIVDRLDQILAILTKLDKAADDHE